jgi:hypothetical protein
VETATTEAEVGEAFAEEAGMESAAEARAEEAAVQASTMDDL